MMTTFRSDRWRCTGCGTERTLDEFPVDSAPPARMTAAVPGVCSRGDAGVEAARELQRAAATGAADRTVTVSVRTVYPPGWQPESARDLRCAIVSAGAVPELRRDVPPARGVATVD